MGENKSIGLELGLIIIIKMNTYMHYLILSSIHHYDADAIIS